MLSRHVLQRPPCPGPVLCLVLLLLLLPWRWFVLVLIQTQTRVLHVAHTKFVQTVLYMFIVRSSHAGNGAFVQAVCYTSLCAQDHASNTDLNATVLQCAAHSDGRHARSRQQRLSTCALAVTPRTAGYRATVLTLHMMHGVLGVGCGRWGCCWG